MRPRRLVRDSVQEAQPGFSPSALPVQLVTVTACVDGAIYLNWVLSHLSLSPMLPFEIK